MLRKVRTTFGIFKLSAKSLLCLEDGDNLKLFKINAVYFLGRYYWTPLLCVRIKMTISVVEQWCQSSSKRKWRRYLQLDKGRSAMTRYKILFHHIMTIHCHTLGASFAKIWINYDCWLCLNHPIHLFWHLYTFKILVLLARRKFRPDEDVIAEVDEYFTSVMILVVDIDALQNRWSQCSVQLLC